MSAGTKTQTQQHEGKTIGDLNGPWSLLLKATLTLGPAWAMAFTVWIVSSLKDLEVKVELGAQDRVNMKERMMDMKERMMDMSRDLDEVKKGVREKL